MQRQGFRDLDESILNMLEWMGAPCGRLRLQNFSNEVLLDYLGLFYYLFSNDAG